MTNKKKEKGMEEKKNVTRKHDYRYRYHLVTDMGYYPF